MSLKFLDPLDSGQEALRRSLVMFLPLILVRVFVTVTTLEPGKVKVELDVESEGNTASALDRTSSIDD